MTALIEYRDVRVDGDDGPIVAGFSAAIPAGRLTVMVGPSGAGKTTLLRLLNRLDDPDGGAVLLRPGGTCATTTSSTSAGGSRWSGRCR